MNSVQCNQHQDLEIHTLICHKDILLAINNFKSLQKFPEFASVDIYLHDDGSLTDSDKNILYQNIQNINFIHRKWADANIENFINSFPYSTQYRLGSSHINLWHKIKLFDYFFFSKTKKILGLDTDLLFIREPRDIISLLNQNCPFYFPDVNNAYCFNEPKNIPTPDRVNTGLIYIPSSEYYNITAIEYALSNLVRNNINYFPSWIEQSAFAHMFYVDKRYKSLSPDKYRIPFFQNIDIKTVECLHFVSYPQTRELYPKYIDYLKFDDSNYIYSKTFNIKFRDYYIPLEIKIKKDKFLIFEFSWCVNQTELKQLSHSFKINGEQHDFQSEANSFFITSLTDHLTIDHSWEWFGEYSWQNLDSVSI